MTQSFECHIRERLAHFVTTSVSKCERDDGMMMVYVCIAHANIARDHRQRERKRKIESAKENVGK